MNATISEGFWAQRRRFNREVLIPDGERRLREAGNFDNLRAAADGGGEYQGLVYQDSDLHKWMEAIGWELRTAPSAELQRMADETVALLEAAQDEDGYLDTAFQVPGRERYANLAFDHEIYCMGHLIEAGVAHPPLLGVARRAADHLVRRFADDGFCGHPEAELALVALHRVTGERAYLDLAAKFVGRRGYEELQPANFGSEYFQDRVPVRRQTQVEGHAVRALYLNCGATDLYLETGDAELLDAMHAQWRDMVEGKTFVTGGVGSEGGYEAFGEPYDLPPTRAYAETCAAIASVLWNWRMLLATGEARFADLLERTLYNGVLAGVALETSDYAYVNRLHVRDGDHRRRRAPWYSCACCPPNVMRLLASLHRYLATEDDGELTIHQYATGTVGGVQVRTDYPWDGRIEVSCERPVQLRVPAWCANARLDGEPVGPGYVSAGPGAVTLELDMRPRLVAADPRIDAVNGCRAIERGPLVYCFEDETVDDVRLAGGLRAVHRPDLLGGIVAIEAEGERAELRRGWPYAPPRAEQGRPETLLAVPYALSGNRGGLPMRVWLPLSESV